MLWAAEQSHQVGIVINFVEITLGGSLGGFIIITDRVRPGSVSRGTYEGLIMSTSYRRPEVVNYNGYPKKL